MMKNYNLNKNFIVGLVGFISLAGCITTGIPEEAIKLNEAEIIENFSGKTAYGTFSRSPGNWFEYFTDDGKTVYKYNDKIMYGVWHIENDALCTRYVSSKDDDEYCWNLYKVGNGFVDSAVSGRHKGKVSARIHKVLDGDIENLMN